MKINPKSKDLVYYGPHDCSRCGQRIAKVSYEQDPKGEIEFDYPQEAYDIKTKGEWPYPNTFPQLPWKRHICPGLEAPVAAIATAILRIDKAMKEIRKTQVTTKLIVTLIKERSKLSQRDIELVLNNLDDMADYWLKKPQK